MAVVPSTRSNIQLRLKEGDLRPVLEFTAEDQDYIRASAGPRSSTQLLKNANLAGATSVLFVWRLRTGTKASASSAAAVFVDKEAGQLRYDWQAGDTDVPGQYYGEFVVTFPDGNQTYPVKGHIKFTIESDLNT
jgi:hypothetical protein